MTLEVPAAIERAIAGGEPVILAHNGVPIGLAVPLNVGPSANDNASEKAAALDNFIAMAGEVDSGERDVSSDKYRHLADIYTSKP